MHSRALHALSRLSRIALPWLTAALALPLCAAPTYVTIGTGALNGVYYPTGGAICRLLNEESERHGVHCTVQSTSGSLTNLADLARGDLQLALVQSDVLYQAAHGTGPFADQPPNGTLRSLFRLHQESLTLLASATSNINTLADIEGKRVDLGSLDSGDRVASQALLEAMGWQASGFAVPPVASSTHRLEGLCNGTLDAALLVAGHPNQGIGDLTGRCKARLIPIEGEQIDQLLKQHPYYQRSRIGANLYPGQTGAINTFAVTAELVAEASLPEETVRTIRDVLGGNLKQFSRLHPALTTLTPESMQAGGIVPLHPGMQDAPPVPALLPSGALTTSGASATAPDAPASAATPPEEAGARPAQPADLTLPVPAVAQSTEPTPSLTGQGNAIGGASSATATEQGALPAATPASSLPSGASPTQARDPAQ